MDKSNKVDGDIISDMDGPVEQSLFENSPTDRFLDEIEKMTKNRWREEFARLGLPVPAEYKD